MGGVEAAWLLGDWRLVDMAESLLREMLRMADSAGMTAVVSHVRARLAEIARERTARNGSDAP